MGWLWFIPIFHLSNSLSSTHETTQFTLTREELDFALGIGSAIIDVEISMQVCGEAEADTVQPLARQTSQELGDEEVDESAGITSAVITAAAGGVKEAVEVKQAVED
jgi:phosphatidylinositol-3,4,5-trisphosphate 3-phosphatase/dual-specificity protein phosphatase PTEN